jgi:hypothetical protein
MFAGEVAAADKIPNHYRSGRFAGGFQRSGRDEFLHELAKSEHDFSNF